MINPSVPEWLQNKQCMIEKIYVIDVFMKFYNFCFVGQILRNLKFNNLFFYLKKKYRTLNIIVKETKPNKP